MASKCPASCGACPSVTLAPKPPIATCVDADASCATWKAAGMADTRVLPFWASSTAGVPCCLCRRMRWCLQSFHGNQLPCELRGVPFCDSRANAECHVQLCSFAVGKLLGLLRQRLPGAIGHLHWQQRHYLRQLILCQLWCYASEPASLRPANMCRTCDSRRASHCHLRRR